MLRDVNQLGLEARRVARIKRCLAAARFDAILTGSPQRFKSFAFSTANDAGVHRALRTWERAFEVVRLCCRGLAFFKLRLGADPVSELGRKGERGKGGILREQISNAFNLMTHIRGHAPEIKRVIEGSLVRSCRTTLRLLRWHRMQDDVAVAVVEHTDVRCQLRDL